MHKLLMLFLTLLTIISSVQSQPSTGPDGSFNQPGSFQANLAVVISVLACMFFLTFFILVYAKFCRRTTPNDALNPGSTLIRSTSRYSGIDKTVIESLPFFRFSSLRGSRKGLECAVCLSKFQDVEILRLLPKCKHAFHIGCVDQWLEKHSSCPLCRHRVSPEDVALVTYTNSLRFLGSHSDLRQDSNLDLFVQREGDDVQGLEDLPIQENGKERLHKHRHKIMFSEFVMNNRWSSLNSSDLMSIHSEMINVTSSYRFENEHNINASKQGINEDVGKQISHDQLGQVLGYPKTATTSKILDPNEKRSMSEIVVHPRFTEFSARDGSTRDSSFCENNVEERMRRLWMPIARRTVQWFVNRDRGSPQSQNVRQSFDM